jgi:hypothetical protein
MLAQRVVPAGSIIQCVTQEGHISSKTTDVGDPILCQINRSSFALPFGSYLAGTFDDFSDPGHFIGKGWMVLRFDRIIISPDTIIPISSKVVDVPKYYIDREGKIHGKGHTTRDAIMWMIPILWPIDIINLPRRGPAPSLRAETRITVKVMDDLELPAPIVREPPVLQTR